MVVENETDVAEEQDEQVSDESTEEQSSEEKSESKPDPDEHRQNKLQRRFDKLTREKYEAKAEADALKKVLAMIQNGQGQSQQQEPQRPQRNQFKDDEEWVEALTEYKVELALQKNNKQQPDDSRDEPETDWDELVEEARERHEDYDDIVQGSDVKIKNQGMEQAITSSGVGPEIAYYLAKHPREARRIDKLSPMAAIRAVGAIEDRITSSVKKKNNANVRGNKSDYEPIEPVSGTGAGAKDPEKMPIGEWMRHEQARLKKLGKR